jgi:DNA-binding FadR family transcriptional regulator
MFGVGRPTVRLALRLLEAEGLIEARRGRTGGTFVLQRTDDGRGVAGEMVTRLLLRRDQIEELLDYRQTLEPAVARLAARTRTAEDIQAMQAAQSGMLAAESEPEYMRYDTEFHVAVGRATHNRYLAEDIEQIRVEINDALSLLPETEAWHRRLEREHGGIFAAIEAGEGDAAAAATELHISASDRGVRAVLASLHRRGR